MAGKPSSSFRPYDIVSLMWVLAAVEWELTRVYKVLPSPWNRCENSQEANVTKYGPVGILKREQAITLKSVLRTMLSK